MNAEAISDATLIQAHLAGDPVALEQLFERYRKPFYAYFNRLLNQDRMSADDLFQELWIKIIDKLPECRNQSNFAAWGFTIAHNLAMQFFRSRKSRAKLGTVTADGNLPEMAATAAASPSAALEEQELRRQLDLALRQLSVEQQEVFQLRKSGMNFREIARLQHCPLNTALGRMHTAMKQLRASFQGGGLS